MFWPSIGYKPNLPIKGQEYTIAHIFDNDEIGEPSYLLKEISNAWYFIPLLKIHRELSFASWRFSKPAIQEEYHEEEEFDNVMEELLESVEKIKETGRKLAA